VPKRRFEFWIGYCTARARSRVYSSLEITFEFFSRSRFFEFIGDAEVDHLTELLASILGPLTLPFRHPTVLRDQIDENP
jgi:hypothetical protein